MCVTKCDKGYKQVRQMLLQSVTGLTKRDRTSITIFDRYDKVLTNIIMCDKCYQQLRIFLVLSTLLLSANPLPPLPKSFPIPVGSINHRVSSVLFFPIFSYFLKNSYFFLFFTKIPIFSYFSAIFFDFHIIFLKS